MAWRGVLLSLLLHAVVGILETRIGRSCTNWGHKQKKYGGPYRNIKTLKMRRNSKIWGPKAGASSRCAEGRPCLSVFTCETPKRNPVDQSFLTWLLG
ncbi:hypothetical protein YC2023_028954 [Brassica napus]